MLFLLMLVNRETKLGYSQRWGHSSICWLITISIILMSGQYSGHITFRNQIGQLCAWLCEERQCPFGKWKFGFPWPKMSRDADRCYWTILACFPGLLLGPLPVQNLCSLRTLMIFCLDCVGVLNKRVVLLSFLMPHNCSPMTLAVCHTNGIYNQKHQLLSIVQSWILAPISVWALKSKSYKISMLYNNHIFQCMDMIFCVEFQRVPLKFHAKYLTHTLKNVDVIHRWKFKSS